MSIKEEKAALRREIKQRIRALSKEDIKSQSISACKLAAGLIAFKNATGRCRGSATPLSW